MSGTGKFLRQVERALEAGADGPYDTKEELKHELEKRGVQIDEVHVFGSGGIYEQSTKDDNKWRLNRHGLDLLLTHLSINQGRRTAFWALLFACLSLVVAGFSLLVAIIALCRPVQIDTSKPLPVKVLDMPVPGEDK